MALTIELGQCTKEKDGTYSVYLKAVRDTGDILADKSFNVSSAAQLKAIVKPIFEQLVEAEQNKETVRAIAQNVIDEIMAEVIQ
jgi:hypothetical protein